MNSNLNQDELGKFKLAVNTDYNKLSSKTDKFRREVDIKKVITYQDLKDFMIYYDNYLSFLSKTQFEMILKNVEWTKTIYTVLAANKFKKLIKA